MTLNTCNFIGNVGSIEYRALQSGDKVANFSLAVSEKYKDKNGERQENTTWINVVVFSKGLVSILEQYISKGDKLFVSGKLQNRQWENKEGVTQYRTEIVLGGFDGKILMLGSKGNDSSGQRNNDQYQQAPDDLDDSVPF